MTAASKNPRVISTLVLVFAAGIAVGALSMQLGLHEKLHRTVSAATKPVSDNDALVQRFRTQLHLSDEQTKEISGVLSEYRPYYRALQDQFDDLRATGRDRIMGLLTEEQQKQFEKMGGDLQPPLQSK